ncbi:MAG TPA: DUF433 domain-containing protein [Vicinamibacteria bacterium]|jgi:uncharacterized protein (DUF433 family)|nr:DUF433 domain-containing protein [Vicinamibacteria bacterium]
MATAAKTVATHITKDPRVCGGKACIDSTRIRVMDIVLLQRQGLKPENMIEYFSVPLTLAQIHGALAYYYDHPEELEGDISDGKRVEAEIERDRALHLKGHSGR